MNSSLSVVQEEYSRTTNFNRSISPAGRIVFLALIFSNTLIIAAGFTLAGAWLVLPFAGVEVVALAVSFYRISLRDGDFERITINSQIVCVEACDEGVDSRVEFNRAWVQLVRRMDGRGCKLSLRSRGKEVPLGRLMNDEQRYNWSREVGDRLRIVNQ